MTEGQFADLLAIGHETTGLEFKPAGPLGGRLMYLVFRALMGMANRRGGGRVIVGVDERGGSVVPVGLSEEELATWTNDALTGQLSRFADPKVAVDYQTCSYKGRSFVVLIVDEFSVVPVICKNSSNDPAEILRKGAIYVRGRQKPETVEVPSYADMRDLFDLAVAKAVSQHMDLISPRKVVGAPVQQEDDFALFRKQSEGLHAAGGLYARIEGRGHWRFVIHPHTYRSQRVRDLLDLRQILLECCASAKGSNVPPLCNEEGQGIGPDWIGETADSEGKLEGWRFFQSGLLVYWSSIPQDWSQGPSAPPAESRRVLGIAEAIFRYTSAFEVAGRLSQSKAGDVEMHVEIEVLGINGRRLLADDLRQAPLDRVFQATDSLTFPWVVDTNREALWAGRQSLALEAARQLFQRFGWGPTVELLQDIQGRL